MPKVLEGEGAKESSAELLRSDLNRVIEIHVGERVMQNFVGNADTP